MPTNCEILLQELHKRLILWEDLRKQSSRLLLTYTIENGVISNINQVQRHHFAGHTKHHPLVHSCAASQCLEASGAERFVWRHRRWTCAWSRQSTPTRRPHSGLVDASRSSLSASSLSQSEGIQSASAAEYQARAAPPRHRHSR